MDILKLEPIFKDYIWGGTNLKEKYGLLRKCHKKEIKMS